MSSTTLTRNSWKLWCNLSVTSLMARNPVFAPVLWRLLLAQASFMHVFIQLADTSKSRITGDLMPPEIEKYQNKRESREHFGQQVDAARRYVEQRLHRLLA